MEDEKKKMPAEFYNILYFYIVNKEKVYDKESFERFKTKGP